MSSNCTFMELKSQTTWVSCSLNGSNCTFMELKFMNGRHPFLEIERSNCTFMELK